MDTNIFRQYKEFKQIELEIQLIENINSVDLYCSENKQTELMKLLDEEYIEYTETDFGYTITEIGLDELNEIFLDYNFESDITEASLMRKTVVRAGKRKVIYRCPPGHKKIKRRCVRRPASELARVKRGARKAARKSKSKRSRANRRRKISLKRRASFAKRHH